jgi:hypothetical protein
MSCTEPALSRLLDITDQTIVAQIKPPQSAPALVS